MSNRLHRASTMRLAFAMLLLLGSSLACSVGEILLGESTPTPSPLAPTALPTWTPSPVGMLSPAQAATETVVAALTLPTLTPTPAPLVTLPVVDTPTPIPTPYVAVAAPLVNVRQGPSVAYPVVGQVRQGESYAVTGRNEALTWWQICFVNGQQGWITSQLTAPGPSMDAVPIAIAPEAPPAAVAASLAPAGTPPPVAPSQPSTPFVIGDGPQYFTSANAWLTIWVKAFYGKPPFFQGAPDYRLRVLRNGVDVSSETRSRVPLEYSAPFVKEDPKAYGNRREYNLKFEYFPEAGDAQWVIYLIDDSGNQVSPQVSFETRSTDLIREVYVGFYDPNR